MMILTFHSVPIVLKHNIYRTLAVAASTGSSKNHNPTQLCIVPITLVTVNGSRVRMHSIRGKNRSLLPFRSTLLLGGTHLVPQLSNSIISNETPNHGTPSVIFCDVLESSDSSPQTRVLYDPSPLKEIISKCFPRSTPVTIAKQISDYRSLTGP